LFYKLSVLGLSSKIIQTLQGLYDQNTCEIWHEDSLSDPFETNVGVKQGCLLSPVLFSLFLNDLHESLPGGIKIGNTVVRVLMYADDIVLLSDSSEGLQTMINAFSEYCSRWELSVNLTKSKVMVFRRSPNISKNIAFLYRDQNIEIVNEYKYLGVLLQYNLSFNKHLDQKLSAAKLAINSTWLKYIYNPKISNFNKLKIFNAASKSIMLYGSQIWGIKRYDQAEKLLRFFIKTMLFLPKNTPNYMLFLETGLDSQYLSTLSMHFKYILKLLTMPQSRLAFTLTVEIWQRKISWAKEWQALCVQLGVTPIENLTDSDLRSKVTEILTRVRDNEHMINVENAKKSSLHDLYSLLEHIPLSCFSNSTAHVNSLVIKARGGLLDINAKAFKKDTFGICTICNLDKPENTFHFIGECPIFANFRNACFNKRTLSLNEVVDILNGTDFHALYNFLNGALKYRNLIIAEFN